MARTCGRAHRGRGRGVAVWLMRPDIAFLTHDLTGTGVVRNSIRLANAAAALGRKTEYWVVHKDGALSGELDSRISVREIGAPAWLPRRIAGLAAVPRLARWCG